MEVRDARVPLSSTCARLEDLIQQKRRIIVMNKSDLIDPADTARWARHFTQQGQAVAFTNASKGSRVGDLMPQQLLKRGLLPRADRMLLFMIIGVPNTGKSTMINALRRNGMRARRQADGVSNVAETGARPGVTRHVSTVQFCSEPSVPSRAPRTGRRQACRITILSLDKPLPSDISTPTIVPPSCGWQSCPNSPEHLHTDMLIHRHTK